MPNKRKAGKHFFGVWIDEEKLLQIKNVLQLRNMNKTEFAIFSFELGIIELKKAEKEKNEKNLRNFYPMQKAHAAKEPVKSGTRGRKFRKPL